MVMCLEDLINYFVQPEEDMGKLLFSWHYLTLNFKAERSIVLPLFHHKAASRYRRELRRTHTTHCELISAEIRMAFFKGKVIAAVLATVINACLVAGRMVIKLDGVIDSIFIENIVWACLLGWNLNGKVKSMTQVNKNPDSPDTLMQIVLADDRISV